MNAAFAIFQRELRLTFRRQTEWAQPLVFYGIVITLFALGADPGSPMLRQFGSTVLWVAALLALLLGGDRLFRDDLDDGTLEQLVLAPAPLAVAVGFKLAAHWLVSGLPLVLISPLVAGAFQLSHDASWALFLGLLLGSPSLALICGFGAAATVALPRAGILLPILILPLAVPVLIYGAGAVRVAQSGLPIDASLYFLAAILMLSICVLPLAAAAALRNAYE